jgi:hypothetical protein
LNHLHSPDETKFCSDRHRPANTFPPVFTGLSIFMDRGRVGFHPIYESMKWADAGAGYGSLEDEIFRAAPLNPA